MSLFAPPPCSPRPVRAAGSELFRGTKPEQLIERLNDRVRQLSEHTLGLRAAMTFDRDKLLLVEIPIVGLDCQACSLGVYDILTRIEGVERATASFRSGQARAWIDPQRTNRQALEEALEGRGVTTR